MSGCLPNAIAPATLSVLKLAQNVRRRMKFKEPSGNGGDEFDSDVSGAVCYEARKTY